MKKFVIKCFAFVLVMAVTDCLCGFIFPLLQSHARGGSTRTNYYLSDECDADILVLGSSRAMHHYVPQILDSLGGIAYNAGNDGMGIVLGAGRYLLCAEQHVPSIVIVDITSFDYVKDDNSKYLKFLRPYSNREGIRKIISQIGESFIHVKLLSHMYRNSSRIIPNIRDLFAKENNYRGYSPLYGLCKNCDDSLKRKENISLKLDSLKLNIMDQFVKETIYRGSKVYFAISPSYSINIDLDSSLGLPPDYIYAGKLAEKYNVPMLNFMFTRGISDRSSMFADRTHMNNDGAFVYTKKIVNEIQKRNK